MVTAIIHERPHNNIAYEIFYPTGPFAILPIFVALEKIDRSFLEAGRDLGESQIMTFIRVTLPLSMPGVAFSAASTVTGL